MHPLPSQVVNVGLFTPGQALKPDTLWIVEQIPGLVVGGDVTQILEMGHFPVSSRRVLWHLAE